ncbi:MAG: hypothetical protein ACLGJC_15665, partial [Alphaproteobacteria bacterium]
MSEISDSRTPRDDHGAEDHSLGHLFKGWLRTVWGGREDTSLRGTIEELIAGLDDAASEDGEDSLGSGERALLTNILKLRDRTVADVMVPRADIIAVGIWHRSRSAPQSWHPGDAHDPPLPPRRPAAFRPVPT